MIPLTLKAVRPPVSGTIVARLNASRSAVDGSPLDAYYIGRRGDALEFDFCGFSLLLEHPNVDELDGDVVLIGEGRNTASRIIRASSEHNTLVVTEKCDQLCIMCSQPPKDYHQDLFPAYREACLLAPKNAIIGISGGEPTLYKEQLLGMLIDLQRHRPDLRFHILTNAQHFEDVDISKLRILASNTIWGVPIYSSKAEQHDRIVGKLGAFANLQKGLKVLAISASIVELRTVVLQTNIDHLQLLGNYISVQYPFFATWAIMQLESIGFARLDWAAKFCDTSARFTNIADAVDIVAGRGFSVHLYNFPRCTVPISYRKFCTRSISDWKSRYLTACGSCHESSICSGFFQWYDERSGFTGVAPIGA